MSTFPVEIAQRMSVVTLLSDQVSMNKAQLEGIRTHRSFLPSLALQPPSNHSVMPLRAVVKLQMLVENDMEVCTQSAEGFLFVT